MALTEPAHSPSGLLRDAAALAYVDDLEAPVLSDKDARHFAVVLRLRPGELVVASDGAGSYRGCRVVPDVGSGSSGGPGPGGSAGRRGSAKRRSPSGISLEPDTEVIAIGRAVPAVTVGFSLAKGERTDWAVAKLTELGIDRIAPLVCDRTVSRSDSVAALATRAGRFGRIAREASMQARRPWRPQVDAPQLLSELLAELLTTAADRPPVPEPGSAGGPAAARTPSAVGIALAEPGGGAPSLAMPVLLIGPEGGWSPAELAMGFPTVSLGNTILRVETAAVVAGALLTGLRSRLVAPVGFATEN